MSHTPSRAASRVDKPIVYKWKFIRALKKKTRKSRVFTFLKTQSKMCRTCKKFTLCNAHCQQYVLFIAIFPNIHEAFLGDV